MNAFTQMTATLAARRQTTPRSKADVMREHMRQNGPCTAADLGQQINASATLASSLLCGDIRTGRVEVDRRQRPLLYSLAANPPLLPSLQRAIDRLEERGYTVIAP